MAVITAELAQILEKNVVLVDNVIFAYGRY